VALGSEHHLSVVNISLHMHPTAMMMLSLAILLVHARNNGIGRLPVMGWNSWCTWGSCDQDPKIWPNLTARFHDVCTEEMVKDVAQSMLDQGLHAAGWTSVNLDDCWEATVRDPATGAMQADPHRFPSGTLKPLADWLHQRNFSFGMYTAVSHPLVVPRTFLPLS
jgi:alpha-galactosidase